ncbi:glycosyltransferase family 4 protein [Halobellus rubicundus]|uniref:Glycosyltransferase family 4 protein n=1 Tax=Halobellus rubicundus TaxID=2996466 RepID=A0ABD5MF41_9EURY
MDVSIFSYRDLGTNVGQTLTYTAEGFFKEGVLQQVYCRGNIKTSLPDSKVTKPIPFGRYGPSFLWLLNKYVYPFDHRTHSMNLLDIFSKRKVSSDTADIHYYEIPGLKRSLNESISGGHETVIVGGTELASAALDRREQEYRKWDLDLEIPSTKRNLANRREETIRDVDHLIALSGFVKESYAKAGISANKIEVINQAVDPDKFSPGKSNEDEMFRGLFVGSVNLMKGIPYLLDGWRQAGFAADESAELVLCGNINPDAKYIIEDKRPTNLQLPGWVDPLPYYRDASVFIFPSLTEGFAKVILEAMSTGTPVIVSENSGGADIITDSEDGFVVPAYDAGEIASKLQYLRENPKELERMGDAARNTAKERTWGKFVDEVIYYLKDIL